MTDKPVYINDAPPLAVIDDAAVARAERVLADCGVTTECATIRQALTAAVTPPAPAEDIPVSLGMIASAQRWWLAHPGASPHVLLPGFYRAMEAKRREEERALAEAAPAEPSP